jgi:hypothetical protein
MRTPPRHSLASATTAPLDKALRSRYSGCCMNKSLKQSHCPHTTIYHVTHSGRELGQLAGDPYRRPSWYQSPAPKPVACTRCGKR